MRAFATQRAIAYEIIGGGSHRLEGVTSYQERVRPVKERVGSSARDGDGEGGINDVYALRILGSRLGRPDGFGCSPVGHAVHDFRTLQLMCHKSLFQSLFPRLTCNLNI